MVYGNINGNHKLNNIIMKIDNFYKKKKIRRSKAYKSFTVK